MAKVYCLVGLLMAIVVIMSFIISVQGLRRSKCNKQWKKMPDNILHRLRNRHKKQPNPHRDPNNKRPSKQTIPVIPRDTSDVFQNLKVASFNVRVFGITKMNYPDVPEILVNIILRYDVILIMEIRDTTSTAIYDLLKRVNQASNAIFKMIISPRLGRTSSKEEYAFIYRSDVLSPVRHYTYDDGDENLLQDTFQREPFIVHFHSSKTVIQDFALVAIHTSPSKAPQEVDSLVDVYDDVIARWSMHDVIILGDLNSACSYMSDSDWKANRLYNDQRFTWLIKDSLDTTVGGGVCAYDRFVVAGSKTKSALVPGSVDRFTFDAAYNLTSDTANLVSDHFPIELELYSQDFTNALQSVREVSEYKYYSRSPPSLSSNLIYKIRYSSNPLLSNGFVAETFKSYSGSIAVVTNKKKVTSSLDALQAFAMIYSQWGNILTKDQVNLASHKVEKDYGDKSFHDAYVKLVCRKIPSPLECWVALEI